MTTISPGSRPATTSTRSPNCSPRRSVLVRAFPPSTTNARSTPANWMTASRGARIAGVGVRRMRARANAPGARLPLGSENSLSKRSERVDASRADATRVIDAVTGPSCCDSTTSDTGSPVRIAVANRSGTSPLNLSLPVATSSKSDVNGGTYWPSETSRSCTAARNGARMVASDRCLFASATCLRAASASASAMPSSASTASRRSREIASSGYSFRARAALARALTRRASA